MARPSVGRSVVPWRKGWVRTGWPRMVRSTAVAAGAAVARAMCSRPPPLATGLGHTLKAEAGTGVAVAVAVRPSSSSKRPASAPAWAAVKA